MTSEVGPEHCLRQLAVHIRVLFSNWLTHHFGFDEVTDHLVVEILDGRPFDPLLNVLLLRTQKHTFTFVFIQEPSDHETEIKVLFAPWRLDQVQVLKHTNAAKGCEMKFV